MKYDYEERLTPESAIEELDDLIFEDSSSSLHSIASDEDDAEMF